MLALAQSMALSLHEGQVDKCGIAYIQHVADVARRVAHHGATIEAIAWLHDAIEDTPLTLEEVEERFGGRIRDGVDAMTRRAGEQYFQHYLPLLMQNADARIVKFADASHNYEKIAQLKALDPASASRLEKKYRKVLAQLREHM